MLDPHHEDDIVPVILEEPDHHRALTVAHRFDHVEWGANPTYRYSIGDPRREAFRLVNLSRGEPEVLTFQAGPCSRLGVGRREAVAG